MTDSKAALNKILLEGCSLLGCHLQLWQADELMQYYEVVREWNEKINLTAIRDEKDFIIKHFIDSLAGAPFLRPQGRLIDIGSGAGFPGVPLKIYYPQLEVCLVESVGKKAEFIETAGNALGLKGISVVNARAEEVGRDSNFREKFDFAVCRAVSELTVIAEYCLPLVKLGGSFLAYKGDKAEEELSRAGVALELLGGTVEQVHKIELPFLGDPRTLIEVRKSQPSPEKYPRRTGVPAKRPLI